MHEAASGLQPRRLSQRQENGKPCFYQFFVNFFFLSLQLRPVAAHNIHRQ